MTVSISGFFRSSFWTILLSAGWAIAIPRAEAQESSAPITVLNQPSVHPVKWYSMFANMPRDWKRWGDGAFSSDRKNEWLWVGASTLVLIVTDDITYSPSQRFYHSGASAKSISDLCAEIGDGRTQFSLAGAFAAYGLVFDDEKAFRTGSQIVQAVLTSGAVVQVLKHVTGRESPFVRSTPTGRWVIFPNQIDYHNFVPYYDAYPSGHICTSMATVIVIAENYPENRWVRPIGYSLTTLVGLGMLSNGIHWLSDYPLGLYLGYWFGMLAAHPEGLPFNGTEPGTGPRISFAPSITPAGGGVSLQIRF